MSHKLIYVFVSTIVHLKMFVTLNQTTECTEIHASYQDNNELKMTVLKFNAPLYTSTTSSIDFYNIGLKLQRNRTVQFLELFCRYQVSIKIGLHVSSSSEQFPFQLFFRGLVQPLTSCLRDIHDLPLLHWLSQFQCIRVLNL